MNKVSWGPASWIGLIGAIAAALAPLVTNLPGTTAGHPNWRRRFKATAVELLDDEDAARRLELLAQAREQAWERDR